MPLSFQAPGFREVGVYIDVAYGVRPGDTAGNTNVVIVGIGRTRIAEFDIPSERRGVVADDVVVEAC